MDNLNFKKKKTKETPKRRRRNPWGQGDFSEVSVRWCLPLPGIVRLKGVQGIMCA